MNTRIREIRNDKNLTQKELGELMGTTRDSITSIENGRTSPNGIFINLFCEKFKVNKEWILHGTGNKYINQNLEDSVSNILNNLEISKSSKLLPIIKNLVGLDDEYLDLIDKLIIGLKK